MIKNRHALPKNAAPRLALLAALAAASAMFSPDLAASEKTIVTGVVRAQEEVVVRSELSGLVQRIDVEEGDVVREGKVLVELKNERQKLALELAKTGLDKAKAAIDETNVLLDNSEKELNRVKTAGSALPRKELDDKTDQVLRLKANMNAQKAEQAQAETEVRMREQELKETQVLAPFSGTVTQIFVHKGDTLRPLDTPILEIVALDDLYTELLIPSSNAHKLTLNQKIMVHVESEWMGTTGQIEGRVSHINPKVDASSRTFLVKVRIPSKSGLIRPGMLAIVEIE
jgi:RND family efflux transporter MFP subunit